MELKDCETETELESTRDVSCFERLNGKGDVASLDVVDTGSNERHGKRASGAPVVETFPGVRVHASEESS